MILELEEDKEKNKFEHSNLPFFLMETFYAGKRKRSKKTEVKEVRKPNNGDGNEYTYDKEIFDLYDDLRDLWDISEMRLDPDQNETPKYKNEFIDEKQWDKAKKFMQKPYIHENLCVICKKEQQTLYWIQCDFCQRWLHMECTGLSHDEIENIGEFGKYKCNICKTLFDEAYDHALEAMQNANKYSLSKTDIIIRIGSRQRKLASWRERLIYIGIDAAKEKLFGPSISGARKIAEEAYINMQKSMNDL